MKERLTGAIILVALIVLLVPELLTGPIRTGSAPAAAATATIAADAGPSAGHALPPLRSYTLTIGATPPSHESVAATATQAPSKPQSSAEEGAPEVAAQGPPAATSQDGAGDTPAQSAEAGSDGLQAAKPPAHPSVQEGRSSAPSSGWVVQLGSFASRQNAERLARSLHARGFRMSVSPARAGSRVLWRVRAGPAHDRASGQHLAARLRALGHRGELLPIR